MYMLNIYKKSINIRSKLIIIPTYVSLLCVVIPISTFYGHFITDTVYKTLIIMHTEVSRYYYKKL